MNTEQITTLLRTVLQIAGGIAVSRGWADGTVVEAVTGAALTVFATAWGLYVRRNTGLVAAAAALPAVSHIVAARKLADAVPSHKVQPL